MTVYDPAAPRAVYQVAPPAGSTTAAIDTELPAAVAAADNLANPTAPSVLAHAVYWDAVNAVWVRARTNPSGEQVVQPRELITVTATAAAGSAATATCPAGAAGKFTHLAYLQIVMYAAGPLTGGATPNLVTTTNLPGSPVFTFPSALAIGTVAEQKFEGAGAIKGSAAATAITIVSPALASCIWRITAAYYIA